MELSYTAFSLSDTVYSATETDITVKTTVTNTGSYAGKEVVQVYYGAPRIADGSKLGNPKAELAGFAKTLLLAPGESETVSVTFPITDMASFDDTGATGSQNKSAYVLEAGKYTLYVGNSVSDALKNPCGIYSVDTTKKTKQLHAYCAPTELEKRLRDDGSYETLTPAAENTANAPKKAESAARVQAEPVITGRDVLSGKASLDELLAQMTEAELISFTVGHDARIDNGTGSIGGSQKVNNKYILPEIQSADGPAACDSDAKPPAGAVKHWLPAPGTRRLPKKWAKESARRRLSAMWMFGLHRASIYNVIRYADAISNTIRRIRCFPEK